MTMWWATGSDSHVKWYIRSYFLKMVAKLSAVPHPLRGLITSSLSGEVSILFP